MTDQASDQAAPKAESESSAENPHEANQVIENMLKGASFVIEGLARQIEPHVPRAAQLLNSAVAELKR